MELRHLRYFVTVAEELNITKAAVRLNVSQPPLSRQIRDLENELGVVLLERSPKEVRLTPVGRVFFKEARGVLRQAAEAVRKDGNLAGRRRRNFASATRLPPPRRFFLGPCALFKGPLRRRASNCLTSPRRNRWLD